MVLLSISQANYASCKIQVLFYFKQTAFQYHLITLCSLFIVEFTKEHLVYFWCFIIRYISNTYLLMFSLG